MALVTPCDVGEGGDPSKYRRDRGFELQELRDFDVSAYALQLATSAITHHPVIASLWAFGLLLAAFAGGLPVSETAAEAYNVMLQHAEVIEVRELGQKALVELQAADAAYRNSRGWFGACDSACTRAYDRVVMAREHVATVQLHRDKVLSEARQEVGVWSAFGVQDVRAAFWSAWQSGKDFAARCTMWDALFMTVGRRDESVYVMVFRLIIQYALNLTIGLCGAFVAFLYNVYCLILSYGSNILSGLAFFLLTFVAGLSILSTYLGMLFGGVGVGCVLLIQQAANQQQLEDENERKGDRRKRLRPDASVPEGKDVV